MPFKMTVLSLAASLALHALAVTSFYVPVWQNHDTPSQSVEISYVRYPKEIPPAPPQIKYLPVVKNVRLSEEIRVFPKEMPHSLGAQLEASVEKFALDHSVKASSLAVNNGEEFLTDPQKGKIFLNYFGQVKQRTRRAVEKGYARERPGRGEVTLMFVLKADGAVVKVFPVDENSSADEPMKDFAVRCVRECSPFPHFPKGLGMERISFNLSILFGESSVSDVEIQKN